MADARNLEPPPSLSHGFRVQWLEPSAAAFPAHKLEAELEVEQLGLEPTPIWDAGAIGRNPVYRAVAPGPSMSYVC